MKCNYPYLMYAWKDARDRKRLTVDFLVHNIPEENFHPKIIKTGMQLELGTVVPPFFLGKRCLVDATSENIDASKRLTINHHKATALAEAADEVRKEHEYGDVIGLQKISLPFQVELDFCSDDGPGWELAVFEHDDEEMQDLCQAYFVLTVELVSIVKPRKNKVRGNLRIVSSPNGRKAMDEDEDDDGL